VPGEDPHTLRTVGSTEEKAIDCTSGQKGAWLSLGPLRARDFTSEEKDCVQQKTGKGKKKKNRKKNPDY